MSWWEKLKAKFKLRRRRPEPVTTVGDVLNAAYNAIGNAYPNYRTLTLPSTKGSTTYYFSPDATSFSMGDITDAGMKILADVLLRNDFHNINTLEFAGTQFTDESIVLLMNTIAASCHKRFKQLDISESSIGDAAAIAIANAIEAGYFPKDFKLKLYRTNIGDAGASALAKAMAHPNCPKYFNFYFVRNAAGINGALAFHDALKEYKFNPRTKLQFYAPLVEEHFHIHSEIESMALNYKENYEARRCLTFYKGLSDPDSPVSLLRRNLDVLPLITAHVIPRANKIKTKINRRDYKQRHGTMDGYLPQHRLFAKNLHMFYKQKMRVNNTASQETTSPAMSLSSP